jgi:hypothetical protein
MLSLIFSNAQFYTIPDEKGNVQVYSNQCIPSPDTNTANPAAIDPQPSREIQLGKRHRMIRLSANKINGMVTH